MKAALILIVLSCVVFALAPINAERQLRAEDTTTDLPLSAFKIAIEKFKKKPESRRLSGEDGKKVVKKLVAATEKIKESGRGRRMEEDNTDYHINNLVGQVNGRNGSPLQ